MRLTLASALAAALLANGPAAADGESEDTAYKTITQIVTVTPSDPKSDDCMVNATADFAKYVDQVAIFREAFLNKEFSVDFYNQRRRQVFAYIVLKRAAELITEGLYHEQTRPECQFSMTIAYADKFGQERKFQALTWRFNAEQAAKVNWEKFDPRDFADVALDYEVKPSVSGWVAEEPQLNDGGKDSSSKATGCDMLLFNANAMFIRATTFCKKDYIDSPEGLAALNGAKKCPLNEKVMEQKAKAAMLTLDQIAQRKGRAAVCPFVDQVAREVHAKMD